MCRAVDGGGGKGALVSGRVTHETVITKANERAHKKAV